MKLSWSKYELSKSYDEYITPKRTVRGHLRKIGNFFESLSVNDLQELIVLLNLLSNQWVSIFVFTQKKVLKNEHGH